MRRQRTAPPDRGFAFLLTLFTLSGLITYSLVGLRISMSEVSTATKATGKTQAFYLAEAGLDGSLNQLRGSSSAAVTTMLSSLPASITCALPGCAAVLADDVAGSTQDTDGIVVLTVTGTAAGVSQRVQATLQVTTGTGPSAFDYMVAGSTVNLDGNASIGDALNSTGKIYAQGPPDQYGNLATSGANNVWVANIDFVNPSSLSLAALCPNCSDVATFHGPPIFNTNAPALPPLQIDLKPYYNQALAEGHVISADQTIQNQTLTGVYYVECGVSVLFKGTVTINGTIVHEGCKGDINLASNSDFTVDSSGPSSFAKGMAIIGVPDIGFGQTTTIHIKGVVMNSGYRSLLKAQGTIEGALIAVADAWVPYPDLVNNPGPGSYSAITFPLAPLNVNNAHLIFQQLPQNTPGLPSSGGVSVQVRSWTTP